MKTYTFITIKIFIMLLFLLYRPAFLTAQWSSALCLSPNATSAILNESMGSCIGVSGNTIHVVWTDQRTSLRAAIYYRHSLDSGLTWNSTIAITDTNLNAWHPAIAVNGSNIHVVWMEIDPLNNAHRTNFYIHSTNGGNNWAPKVQLDTAVADWPAIAVSGNIIYVVNDIRTSLTPYNTEIFLLKSTNNGVTWSPHQQVTFALDRSEDEAIAVQGSNIHLSWNDKRSGQMQFFYKESTNSGTTWGNDVLLLPNTVYGPGICAYSAYIDATCSQTPNGLHPQIHLEQSTNNGATWESDKNLTNDTTRGYYYPAMVRCGTDLHVTYMVIGTGGQYLHSSNGGASWSPPFTFFSGNIGITAFPAYTGCVLHILYSNNSDHKVYYIRNPTGNAGHCGNVSIVNDVNEKNNQLNIFPNPAKDLLNISGENLDDGNYFFSIKNELGMVVLSDKVNIEYNTIQKTIPISDLPDGIYFLTIENAKTCIINKIVKQNQ